MQSFLLPVNLCSFSSHASREMIPNETWCACSTHHRKDGSTEIAHSLPLNDLTRAPLDDNLVDSFWLPIDQRGLGVLLQFEAREVGYARVGGRGDELRSKEMQAIRGICKSSNGSFPEYKTPLGSSSCPCATSTNLVHSPTI